MSAIVTRLSPQTGSSPTRSLGWTWRRRSRWYEGDHMNHIRDRFEAKVLPFFSRQLGERGGQVSRAALRIHALTVVGVAAAAIVAWRFAETCRRAVADGADVHHGATKRRRRDLQRELRVLPRKESGRRRVWSPAQRRRVPIGVVRQIGGRAVHQDRDDAAVGAGFARRRETTESARVLMSQNQLAPSSKAAAGRHRSAQRDAAAWRDWRAERRTVAVRRAATRSARRESARQVHAGHRRAAAEPARRRMAVVAARLRRSGIQPTQADQQVERRRAARGVELGTAERPE